MKISKTFKKYFNFVLKFIPASIQSFLIRSVQLFFQFKVLDLSSQAAYYWLLSFFPFVFCVLLFLANINLDITHVDQSIVNAIPNYLLPLFKSLEANISKNGIQILSISFVLLLISSSSATAVLIKNIRLLFDDKSKRNFFIERTISFGFNILFIIFIFSSIIFYLFIKNILDSLAVYLNLDLPIFISLISYLIVPLSIFFLLIVLNYIAVPSLKLRYTLWGSLVSTVGFLLFFKIINIYFTIHNLYTKAYGILGTILILLIYFYFLSVIILLGAIINKTLLDNYQVKKNE